MAPDELYEPLGVGDLNGDGFSDFVRFNSLYSASGSTFDGMVRLYHGGIPLPTSPVQTIIGAPGAYFGSGATTAHDLNGDFFADCVIYSFNSSFVYAGSPQGMLSMPLAELSSWVAPLDVNGDGLGDLARSTGSSLQFFLGTAGSFDAMSDGMVALPAGNWKPEYLGRANGDLSSDIVIVDSQADPGGIMNAGQMLVYFGVAPASASGPKATLSGAAANDGLTIFPGNTPF
jgi:hypothetical protein